MSNNCLTVFFIIEREHKFGHKEVDHILPFFYLLSNRKDIKFSARGIIYGHESIIAEKSDLRIKLLSNIKNVEIIDPYDVNNWYIRSIRKLNKKKRGRIANKIIRILTTFILRRYRNINNKIIWKEVLGEEFIKSKMPVILSLNLAERIKKNVLKIKALNPASKWVVIPHGTMISDNRMVWYKDLDRDDSIQINPLFKDLDYCLFTSKRDLIDAISAGLQKEKGYIIGSPRFCSEWMQKKQKLGLDGPIPEKGKHAKLRILFLIPKYFINIFDAELIRTIEFISNYDEIDLILNRASESYPKLPTRILKRSNVRDYLISNEYSTGALVDWADVVMHAGTGVIFEAFMKEKITVFPRYLTCNTLICEKYDAGWTLKNRDELREFCNMAVKSITNTKKKYLQYHGSSNKKFIDDFVYGNSKSVIDNIGCFFKQIQKEK